MVMRKSLFIGYLLVYVFSASINYFFVKFGLKYSTPLGYMAIRYAIAGALLAMAAALINGEYHVVLGRDLILLSLFSSLSSALWAYGLLYIDPGSSAIFGYTMPLFAIPLSIVLVHERPRTLNIIGAIIGFVGVVVYGVSSIMRGVSLIGALLTVANAVFWALYSIYFKRLGGNDGLIVVSNMFIVGSLMLAVMGLLVNGPQAFTGIEWVPGFIDDLLGTSVVGGAVLFLAWYLLVNAVGVANSVPYIFAVPALTLVLDYLIMGIQPTTPEIIGSVIMLIGIYLASA